MRDLQQDSNGGYGFWLDALNYVVGVFSLLMCLVGIFFMTAVMKTRKFTFNLYVIFAILPDALCNGIIGVNSFYEAYGISPQLLCTWMNFQMIFYYYSNLYINAVIAKEIYHFTLSSYKRRRTKQPSARRVITQMGIIFVLTGLLSFWYIAAPISWSLMTAENEPCCSSKFKHPWVSIVVMVFAMPPMLYVFAIGYKVKKEKILPLKGHTRCLALYFMRIIVIFLTFYIPIVVFALAVNFISPGPNDPIKVNYFVTLQVLRLLFPIQNIVTFKLLLEKKDISDALYDCAAKISSFITVEPSDRDLTDPTDESNEWYEDDIYSHDTNDANDVIDIDHPTVD